MEHLIIPKTMMKTGLLERIIFIIIFLLVVANLVAAGVCIIQQRHMKRQITSIETIQHEIQDQFDETGNQWQILKPWEER